MGLLLFGRLGRHAGVHILDERRKPLDGQPVSLAGFGQ